MMHQVRYLYLFRRLLKNGSSTGIVGQARQKTEQMATSRPGPRNIFRGRRDKCRRIWEGCLRMLRREKGPQA